MYSEHFSFPLSPQFLNKQLTRNTPKSHLTSIINIYLYELACCSDLCLHLNIPYSLLWRALSTYWLCFVQSIMLIVSSSHELNNHVQRPVFNYISQLYFILETSLHIGDFTIAYYQKGEVEYIHINHHCTLEASSHGLNLQELLLT